MRDDASEEARGGSSGEVRTDGWTGRRAGELRNVDEQLVARVASLSVGSQRWLKTAIRAIQNTGLLADEEQPVKKPSAPAEEGEPPKRRSVSLEDVITGKADLRKQMESYPELAEELDGLAEVIDMLRDLGARRRSIGERILREEILGQPPESGEREEGYEEKP